jgi:hypothetical protein
MKNELEDSNGNRHRYIRKYLKILSQHLTEETKKIIESLGHESQWYWHVSGVP